MKKEEHCRKCHARSGFCKHTIEMQYKEWASEMPQDAQELKRSWEQLNRSHAIDFTDKLNILEYNRKAESEVDSLRAENNQLQKELSHFQYIIEAVEKFRNSDKGGKHD